MANYQSKKRVDEINLRVRATTLEAQMNALIGVVDRFEKRLSDIEAALNYKSAKTVTHSQIVKSRYLVDNDAAKKLYNVEVQLTELVNSIAAIRNS